MKKLSLIIEIHQPMRLRTYRFSEIGNDHYYYDDYENEYFIRKASEECYIPLNEILLNSVHQHANRLKLSLLFSGIVLDQFELYAPDVLGSYRSLINSGNVKLLTGSYSNTLKLPEGNSEIRRQATLQKKRIKLIFSNNPVVDGGIDILKPDPGVPGIKLVVIDEKSGNCFIRLFPSRLLNQQPLSFEQLRIYCNPVETDDCNITLLIPYSISGDYRNKWLNDFLISLPDEVFSDSYRPQGENPATILNSSVGKTEEKSAVPDFGNPGKHVLSVNEMQKDAFEKLYSLSSEVENCKDEEISKDWLYLQSRDHFYFMDEEMYEESNPLRELMPYDSAFLAYINYMNVLEDFSGRLNSLKSRRIRVNKPAFKKWTDALNKCVIPNLLEGQKV